MTIEPITREEKFLAKAGGQNVETPEPITRKEMFLDAVAKNGGGGGTGGVTSWNDLEDKPFGYTVNDKYELLNETYLGTRFDSLVLPNNIVKENPTDMNSRTITVSGIPLDILDNVNYIKYVTSDGIMYPRLVWNWIDDTTKQAVYGPYNSTIKVVYSEDYTSATVSIQLPTSMDGLLYCVPISIDNVTVNPLSSDFIVLTAPNRIKYSLSVDNDGNLTAVSVD